MFYKQKLSEDGFRVVELVKWNDEEVLMRDLKEDLLYVISWEVFFLYHEELMYECESPDDYVGADLSKLLD